MVDPQPAGVPQRGPDRLDERLVGGRAELGGDKRRQLPVLAVGVEGVGRGADDHLVGQQVLPLPGVRAAGIHADRQILQDGNRTRGLGQLPVQEPLQPGMIVHLAGMLGGEPRDGRVLGRRYSSGHFRQSGPNFSANAQNVAKRSSDTPCSRRKAANSRLPSPPAPLPVGEGSSLTPCPSPSGEGSASPSPQIARRACCLSWKTRSRSSRGKAFSPRASAASCGNCGPSRSAPGTSSTRR